MSRAALQCDAAPMEIDYPENFKFYDSTAADNLVQHPDIWRWEKNEEIPIGEIRVNSHDGGRRRWNRPSFHAEVSDLIEQIEHHRYFMAVLVWRNANCYTVLDGHHRLRAAKRLGWKKIPCMVLGPA